MFLPKRFMTCEMAALLKMAEISTDVYNHNGYGMEMNSSGSGKDPYRTSLGLDISLVLASIQFLSIAKVSLLLKCRKLQVY